MRISGSFIDCIYELDLYEQDMREIRNKLINRLPDKLICDLASVLIIDTKFDMYAVKIRMCDTKDDYHNLSDGKSEMNINDWRNITKKTNELITPGTNVIFKMDIDVDSLI